MMKKISILFLIIFASIAANAQNPDAAKLHENARTFMNQGDYSNAILILNRLLQNDPKNMELYKDLAVSYYLQKDNAKALEAIKPVLESNEVDDQCFQVAGSIYKAMNDPDAAEKNYKKGLKKFPNSGLLYNEMGELLMAEHNYASISQWEKGIEVDPNFSRNYYNAAKFYFPTADKVRGILYGEIFVNLEPFSNKVPEMKEMLLEGYKKLFSDADLEQNNKDKNSFIKTYLQVMNKQTGLVTQGINTETLTMIRTRFILDWNNSQLKFAFQLFDYQRQLLQEGLFDAYNQWLFGSVQNLPGFQNCITTHATEYNAFSNFQKEQVFRIPAGQYYN